MELCPISAKSGRFRSLPSQAQRPFFVLLLASNYYLVNYHFVLEGNGTKMENMPRKQAGKAKRRQAEFISLRLTEEKRRRNGSHGVSLESEKDIHGCMYLYSTAAGHVLGMNVLLESYVSLG
jgi:hypothetical protein